MGTHIGSAVLRSKCPRLLALPDFGFKKPKIDKCTFVTRLRTRRCNQVMISSPIPSNDESGFCKQFVGWFVPIVLSKTDVQVVEYIRLFVGSVLQWTTGAFCVVGPIFYFQRVIGVS